MVRSPLFGTIALDFLVKGDPHPCPYLPGMIAQEEAFCADEFPAELYHDFMSYEFRRSGNIFYRPVCRDCRECRPLRVPIHLFSPNKSMRRVLRKNEDVTVQVGPPRFTAEKARIYTAYLAEQHLSARLSAPDDLWRFLYTSPVTSLEFQYRLKDRIIAVGITDKCSRSLSSVYTFFDPEFSKRSPGTLSALREILWCKQQGIPYYHLGFLVARCASMSYKSRFKPCEVLSEAGQWVAYKGPVTK